MSIGSPQAEMESPGGGAAAALLKDEEQADGPAGKNGACTLVAARGEWMAGACLAAASRSIDAPDPAMAEAWWVFPGGPVDGAASWAIGKACGRWAPRVVPITTNEQGAVPGRALGCACNRNAENGLDCRDGVCGGDPVSDERSIGAAVLGRSSGLSGACIVPCPTPCIG
eukprot:scaffold12763_cov115-Isochrysis_galbana.AAC.3